MKGKLLVISLFLFTNHLFSGIGIGKSNEGPLPVNLTAFSAEIQNNSVLLKWITATESNNYGFEIERKQKVTGDNKDWEKIAFVKGSGNSISKKEYSYSDNSVSSGKYFYRLKQLDFNGTFKYSEIVEIDLKLPVKCELFQNYPNPFYKNSKGSPITTIEYSIPRDDNSNFEKSEFSNGRLVVLKIFNILGEEVALLVNSEKEAGRYKVQFDASYLPTGIYVYSLTVGKITVSKKFVLMK